MNESTPIDLVFLFIEFVQGYPNKESCTIERSHFIQEHALRPEKLRALLLGMSA